MIHERALEETATSPLSLMAVVARRRIGRRSIDLDPLGIGVQEADVHSEVEAAADHIAMSVDVGRIDAGVGAHPPISNMPTPGSSRNPSCLPSASSETPVI